jgi:hypothetical protein
MSLTRIAVQGSWDYTFDPDKFLNVEIMAIEHVTGMTGMEWQDGLNRGSITAVTALLWILIKRHDDPTVKFDEIVFQASDVWLGASDEQTPWDEQLDSEGKADSPEPSPETGSQTPTTSMSSDSLFILDSDPGRQNDSPIPSI